MEETINQRVIKLRKMLYLNQRSFAEKVGITQTSLSMIENGGGISSKTIKKITENLGVNRQWLMEGKGEILKDEKKEEKSLISQLDVFKGVLIGKGYWEELESFFPKFKAFSI